jgi:cytochrome c oxidase cbb3-type subunit III
MKREVLSAAAIGIAMAMMFHAYSQSAQIPPTTPSAADLAQAQQTFAKTCSGCHGEGGLGGDRAPSLIDSSDMRKLGVAEISGIIKGGTTHGMPAYSTMPDEQVGQLARWLHSKNLSGLTTSPAEQVAAGEKFFFGEGGCSSCHMVHGHGGSNGPDLSSAGLQLTRDDITKMLDDPTSQMGTKRTPACPGWAFCPNLEWSVADVKLRTGGELRGFLRHESEHSIIVQDFTGKEHMLNDKQYASYAREATSYMPALHATAEQRSDLLAYLGGLGGTPLGPLDKAPSFDPKDMDAVIHTRPGEWPSYNGGPNGNR